MVDPKTLLLQIIPAMMDGRPLNDQLGIIQGVKINADRIVLYSGPNFTDKELKRVALEKKDIVDMTIIESTMRKYPRVKLINKGTKEKPERVLVMLRVEDTQLVDPATEKGTLGTQLLIHVDSVYVDKGKLYEADPRPVSEKLLERAYASLDTYIVMQLVLAGFQEGIYKKESKILLGKKNNKLVPLGPVPELKMESKKVDFGPRLKVMYYKYGKTQDTFRYRVPMMHNLTLNNQLLKVLEKRSGIVILDNLMVTDFLNSNSIAGMKEYKNMLFIGDDITSRSEYLMVDADSVLKGDAIQVLKKTRYDYIIDDDNKLSYKDVLELAENSLVIISENTSNLDSFIKKFDILDNDTFENFIDKTLYIGSIYTSYGLELTDSSRRLLKMKDLRLFSEVTSVNTIESTVSLLTEEKNKDIDEILIKPKETIITSGDKIKRINQTFFQSDIVYTLWRLEKELNTDLLSKIEDKGYCVAVTSAPKQDPTGKQTSVPLKYLFFGDRTKIHLKVSPITLKELKVPESTLKAIKPGVNVIVANSGEGKTNLAKNIIANMPSKRRIYVYDKEYDIVDQELDYIEAYIHRNNLEEKFLKHYAPDTVLINSELSEEEIKRLFTVLNKKQTIILLISAPTLGAKLKTSPALASVLTKEDGTSAGLLKTIITPKITQTEGVSMCKIVSDIIPEGSIVN